MTEVVITGASGFIGRALCKRLYNDGLEIFALSHEAGDVADASTWRNLPKADCLVHLAGATYIPDSWNSPADFMRINVLGTQLALDWCKRNRARLIYSSAYVYGAPARLPVSEFDPVSPNNPYALSKYLAEQCCEFFAKSSSINVTVLRLFNVFGFGQRGEFLIPSLIRQLESDQITVGDLIPKRDFVYLPDVIDAFVCALKLNEGFKRINIASGKSYSVEEVISTLQAVAGTNLPVTSERSARLNEISDVRGDITLAMKLLSWKPSFDLASGLQHLLNQGNCEAYE